MPRSRAPVQVRRAGWDASTPERHRNFALRPGFRCLVAPRTLLLALLVCLTALLLPSSPAHARAFEVGMAADGLLLNGSETDGRKAVARWRELGVDTVRLQVQW